MTPRLLIATHIYPHLILRDFPKSVRRPDEVAHRTLLFADALLISACLSTPDVEEDGETLARPLCLARPELASALAKLRSEGRPSN